MGIMVICLISLGVPLDISGELFLTASLFLLWSHNKKLVSVYVVRG